MQREPTITVTTRFSELLKVPKTRCFIWLPNSWHSSLLELFCVCGQHAHQEVRRTSARSTGAQFLVPNNSYQFWWELFMQWNHLEKQSPKLKPWDISLLNLKIRYSTYISMIFYTCLNCFDSCYIVSGPYSNINWSRIDCEQKYKQDLLLDKQCLILMVSILNTSVCL